MFQYRTLGASIISEFQVLLRTECEVKQKPEFKIVERNCVQKEHPKECDRRKRLMNEIRKSFTFQNLPE